MEIVYRTKDLKLFTNKEEAEKHEQELLSSNTKYFNSFWQVVQADRKLFYEWLDSQLSQNNKYLYNYIDNIRAEYGNWKKSNNNLMYLDNDKYYSYNEAWGRNKEEITILMLKYEFPQLPQTKEMANMALWEYDDEIDLETTRRNFNRLIGLTQIK
jgi:hypothetical protein